MYDFGLVEPGPLPPHERSWRHPSELGPNPADIDTGSKHIAATLTIGAVAVLAVAGMVVAMTPKTTSSPVALSATTAPTSPATAATVSLTSTPGGATPREATASTAGISAAGIPVGALLSSFSAFPHAITSAPQLTLDGTDIAEELPAAADRVFVRTEAVTYELQWGQVAYLSSPDGTVIFTVEGDLVAHVVDGQLITIVDD